MQLHLFRNIYNITPKKERILYFPFWGGRERGLKTKQFVIKCIHFLLHIALVHLMRLPLPERELKGVHLLSKPSRNVYEPIWWNIYITTIRKLIIAVKFRLWTFTRVWQILQKLRAGFLIMTYTGMKTSLTWIHLKSHKSIRNGEHSILISSI